MPTNERRETRRWKKKKRHGKERKDRGSEKILGERQWTQTKIITQKKKEDKAVKKTIGKIEKQRKRKKMELMRKREKTEFEEKERSNYRNR